MNAKNLTTEYVKYKLGEFGAELIGGYIDAKTKIKVKCSCGHLRTVKFHPFIAPTDSHLCKKCSPNIGGKKIGKDGIEKRFNEKGYFLIDDLKNIKAKQRLNIIDQDGYKYFSNISHVENSRVRKICNTNPHSTENILLWISKNNKPYSYVKGEYISNLDLSITLKCNVCRCEWDTCWNYMLCGFGCSYCGKKKVTKENSFGSLFPELLKDWDYEKNLKSPYKYSPYSNKSVFWKCSVCNKEWPAEIQSRTNENHTGCPRCSESAGEKEIGFFLNKKNIKFIDEYFGFKDCRNKRILPFDFFLPDYNATIEYSGIQHMEPVDFAGRGIDWAQKQFEYIQKNDAIKEQYCLDHNIPLLKIPYWDFSRIPEILTEYLNL